MRGRVLIVAGSDLGGGAGIQADIKTVTALDGYAATAITALTAQNTQGVFGVFPIKPDFVRKQIDLVLDDIGADAIKTGMLYDELIINALADALEAHGKPTKLVVDPVMLAKGGAPLIDPNAVAALKRRIINLSTIITPNLLEAEKLAGTSIRTVDDMEHAALALLTLGCEAALITGGHLELQVLTDVLATSRGVQRFRSERIPTKHTHGTGCTLASAIATSLAQGMQIEEFGGARARLCPPRDRIGTGLRPRAGADQPRTYRGVRHGAGPCGVGTGAQFREGAGQESDRQAPAGQEGGAQARRQGQAQARLTVDGDPALAFGRRVGRDGKRVQCYAACGERADHAVERIGTRDHHLLLIG